MSDQRRLLRGISANLMAVATRIAVQFATLPIFFASWSVEAVGSWLILFAVPAYVALVGNGFAGAGGTAALAAAQAGDLPRARQDFRAAWTISAFSTAALALVFTSAAMFLIPSVVDYDGEVAIWDMAKAAAWLALYIFASSQMAIFDIPYRVAGRYPDHIFLYNATSLLEIVVIAAAVTFSDSLSTLAMSLALFRCISALWIFLSARRIAPQMFESGHGDMQSSLTDLWRPSLAFMLMPLVFGLNLQGYLLLVGASFGAVLLAGFAATRTLTRLLDLFSNVAYGLQFYESGYIKGDKRAVQRRLLATMSLVSLAIAVVFALVLFLVGPWLQDLYTMGQTTFSTPVALALILAATLRALAAAPMAILAADNAHAPVIVIYVAGSAIALMLAAMLALAGSTLPVVLLPLVLAEASQLVPGLRRAFASLELAPREFFASLTSPERMEDTKLLWQALRSK